MQGVPGTYSTFGLPGSIGVGGPTMPPTVPYSSTLGGGTGGKGP